MPVKKAAQKTTKSAKPTAKKAVRKPAKRTDGGTALAKTGNEAASKHIDRRIEELGDWRGKTLEKVRQLIKKADPKIVEEWKWEVPVWSRDGIVCTGETYKNAVKLTFAKGAFLKDPSGLFTSSLGGNVRRAMDIRENEKFDEAALRDLIRAAVALNQEKPPARRGKR